MSSNQFNKLLTTILILQTITKSCYSSYNKPKKFQIPEATVEQLQTAFQENKLTSKDLVDYYLTKINNLNPILRAVIEVNPVAAEEAQKADNRREITRKGGNRTGYPQGGWLDGIPILIKDNIGTKDKLNTSGGSYALVGSILSKESGVVKRLRKAGVIIIGKASLSEWAHFRSFSIPSGWNARCGQGLNPYNLSADPCGSSSGSAIAVAANMVAVSLGTETDGSILCPSSANSVVGIKPTVGLTSRSGVIPISPRQDTVGPICRTVADAVHVLDAIVGFDPNDSEATRNASKYIPTGGYIQFLNVDGLRLKRLGIIRHPFFNFNHGSHQDTAFIQHFQTLRHRGAVLIDDLEIPNLDLIQSSSEELTMLLAEFKLSLNSYLKELDASPVRSLADVIEFNNKFSKEEKTKEYGQEAFILAEATNGIGDKEKKALLKLEEWSRNGFEKIMKANELDAVITPGSVFSTVLAIGGYPGITVPAGYDNKDVPFGICFGGLRGTEPKLIEIAYAFEHATNVRKPPAFPLNGYLLSSSSVKHDDDQEL
ncbi:hypothetical protein KSS87_021653 [Heliosperma pusillum]|nr:hypothetical protein KSS87_021653 [Heliosperma pusillum]